MKRLAAIALLLALSGCATAPTGSGASWWNPLTWGGSQAARVEKRQAALVGNEAALITAAQAETAKTTVALDAAPAGHEVEVAKRTNRNVAALLDAANGPLTFGKLKEAREIAEGLLARTVEAERDQARAEARAADLSAENAELKARLETATGKLQVAYEKERALANKWRNLVWIAGGLFALWLVAQVLATAARFNPALGGVATVVNGLVNPALAVAHSRAVDGLHRIGRGMAQIRAKLPEVAERVETIFVGETDEEHQKHISYAAPDRQ
jgi:hypothetical protein